MYTNITRLLYLAAARLRHAVHVDSTRVTVDAGETLGRCAAVVAVDDVDRLTHRARDVQLVTVLTRQASDRLSNTTCERQDATLAECAPRQAFCCVCVSVACTCT